MIICRGYPQILTDGDFRSSSKIGKGCKQPDAILGVADSDATFDRSHTMPIIRHPRIPRPGRRRFPPFDVQALNEA